MEKTNYELRSLMDKLQEEYEALEHDRRISIGEGDLIAKLICESLQRQLRITMSQLGTAMKNIGVLDEREIEALKIQQEDSEV